jgi:hypothetical protein
MLAEPYRKGTPARLNKGALGLTAAGALTLASLGRGSRVAAPAGGAATLAGAALERWAVFRAGVESARDPRYTVVPQRQRIEQRVRDGVNGHRDGHGA